MDTIEDEIRYEMYEEKEKLIMQLARLINCIHSDIFQK